MLLAREGRSLVSRCECIPDKITSNYEYLAVNLSEDVRPPSGADFREAGTHGPKRWNRPYG